MDQGHQSVQPCQEDCQPHRDEKESPRDAKGRKNYLLHQECEYWAGWPAQPVEQKNPKAEDSSKAYNEHQNNLCHNRKTAG
jgi:hypothetical protein